MNTLRWAIEQADAATSASSIEIELGSSPATITLMQGQLELDNTAYPTTIYDGPGEGGVTISGNNASRVFQVDGGVTASISGLTITGGSDSNGGGLDNYGGNLTMTGCTVSGNSAGSYGGGLYSNSSGTTTLTDCTVSGNSAGYGAGLWNSGTATLTDCTVTGNSNVLSLTPTAAGGLYNVGGTLTLTDCTVSGNNGYLYVGGVVTRYGILTLTNCTVSDNTTYSVVCRLGLIRYGYSTTTLNNTIVAGNTGGFQDVIGNMSGSNNLIGTGSDFMNGVDGNIVDVTNPLLAPLGNYGGPTQTMALLPGSLAIDAGNNMLIPGGATTDQRGDHRIVNGSVDIGAFESSGFTIAVTSGSDQTAGAVFPEPLVATVTANNLIEPVAGGLVTFTPPRQRSLGDYDRQPGARSAPAARRASRPRTTASPAATPSRPRPAALRLRPRSALRTTRWSRSQSPPATRNWPWVSRDSSAPRAPSPTARLRDITDLATWASATPSVAAISATGLASARGRGAKRDHRVTGGRHEPRRHVERDRPQSRRQHHRRRYSVSIPVPPAFAKRSRAPTPSRTK